MAKEQSMESWERMLQIQGLQIVMSHTAGTTCLVRKAMPDYHVQSTVWFCTQLQKILPVGGEVIIYSFFASMIDIILQ